MQKLKGSVTISSNGYDKVYYWSKITDGTLFVSMKNKYDRYIIVEFLTQCCHICNTQLNEGMKQIVIKYTPECTNYCQTNSLIT